MEFTFLGTSAGTPTRARNVTGLALQHGGPRQWYLIDCGEGTQHQLLRTRLSVMQLKAIFITHMHGDHTFGLPGLLASASMAGRTEPLALIGPPQLRPFIDTTLANTDSSLSFELQYIDSEAGDFCWQDNAFRVTSHPLSHRVPCHAFRFEEIRLERKLLTDQLAADGIEPGPDWGRLQKGHDVRLADGRLVRADDYTAIPRPPRRVVVAGDNDTPDLLTNACQDAHLLIHEATYTQEVADRVGPWPQHSSARQVATFARTVNLPHLILTHFSSRYQTGGSRGPMIDDIADEARSSYPGGLHMARDFQRYRLDRDLTLEEISE